jgi:hypothetical protein
MLSLFLLLLMTANQSHSQSAVPSAGLYTGNLQLNQGGRKIPFQLALSFSEDEIPAEAEEILLAKRALRASLVLDTEAGPYNFSKVSYFIEDGRMDLQYFRSTDDPNGTPRFRMTGKMNNHVFQGRVLTAGLGEIGTFSVARSASSGNLSVGTKYMGNYRGVIKASTGNFNINVRLSAGVGTDPTPASYDFDFGPRKAGALEIENLTSSPIVLTRVNIDYLKGTIEMAVVGGSGELTLRGTLSENVIRGKAFSPTLSGDFELRREP